MELGREYEAVIEGDFKNHQAEHPHLQGLSGDADNIRITQTDLTIHRFGEPRCINVHHITPNSPSPRAGVCLKHIDAVTVHGCDVVEPVLCNVMSEPLESVRVLLNADNMSEGV